VAFSTKGEVVSVIEIRRARLEDAGSADNEFMVLELKRGALHGVSGIVRYQPEFSEGGC